MSASYLRTLLAAVVVHALHTHGRTDLLLGLSREDGRRWALFDDDGGEITAGDIGGTPEALLIAWLQAEGADVPVDTSATLSLLDEVSP